jgi:ArsR family transcriptional regulator
MNENKIETSISNLLKNISHPTRLRILFAIGSGEACVCHLETVLGYRQAYISQHLMELRKAEILTTSRNGRFIYYRLRDVQVLDIIKTAGTVAGISEKELDQLSTPKIISNCCCPKCTQQYNLSIESEDEISS